MFPEQLVTIATKLVECCNSRQEAEALNTLYDEACVSVEAAAMGDGGREAVGLDAIRGKHDWWFGAHEVHSASAEGPYLFGDDKFSLIFDMDVTNKESGQRMQMREVGLYTVKDGKIIREEFFYPPMG
ncbi:MAG: nuclear transport factor 2 family protein [Hyphomonadaceae bacterium]|nr:nuclear transport factor 2 family protein [Hyphomonadaceae bacterium]